MKTHRIVHRIMLACYLFAVHASGASDTVSDQIAQLRTQREKTIKDAVTRANEDYATGLDRLKTLYANTPEALELIAREKEKSAKASLATVSTMHKRPKARTPEDLANYLTGTCWDYYANDKFLGEAQKLKFTGPATATLNGKPIDWHVLDHERIWITGNREFTFNSLFDEFEGGWVPNNKDRNTGRLIE